MTRKEPPKPTWRLFVHPAFSDPFDALVAEVARLRKSDPGGYVQHPKAKLLKRIVDLIETEIPRDPGAAEYNLGNTLGPAHRHWRRAKFLGRFRLFFRYNSQAAVIIYVWSTMKIRCAKPAAATIPTMFSAACCEEAGPRTTGTP